MTLAIYANSYGEDWSDIWDYEIECSECEFVFESTLRWDGDYWTSRNDAWNVCPKCNTRQTLELTGSPDEPVREVQFGDGGAARGSDPAGGFDHRQHLLRPAARPRLDPFFRHAFAVCDAYGRMAAEALGEDQ